MASSVRLNKIFVHNSFNVWCLVITQYRCFVSIYFENKSFSWILIQFRYFISRSQVSITNSNITTWPLLYYHQLKIILNSCRNKGNNCESFPVVEINRLISKNTGYPRPSLLAREKSQEWHLRPKSHCYPKFPPVS